MATALPADYVTAASGSAAVRTLSPVAGGRVNLRRIDACYRGAPTSGLLTVSSGRGTLWQTALTAAGPAPFDFKDGDLMGLVDEVLTVTLADGGQTKDLNVRWDSR